MNQETEIKHNRVLAERARSYREHKKNSAQSYKDKLCLSFSICGQPCLLPMENIAGLQSDPTLTELPFSFDAHRGLFSARGAINEVFCLNTIAGGEAPSLMVIVTLQSPHHGLSLGLEKIEGTELVDESELRPLDDGLGPPGASGITPNGEYFIQLTALLKNIH